MADGNLSKLTIIACSDDRFQDEGESISVPVNPRKYDRTFKIMYNEEQEQGTQGNNPPFTRTPPEEIQFEFLYDNTGVIAGSSDIKSKIDQFKKIVYRVEGEIHRPNFIKLIWGDLSFNCVLKDLKISYTLFKPDGTPIRAMVATTFMHVVEEERRAAEQSNSSPDLTHIRYVKEGDTLPLMSYKMYGDPTLYIQVARYNGINNFRDLKIHSPIIFPPIDKSSS